MENIFRQIRAMRVDEFEHFLKKRRKFIDRLQLEYYKSGRDKTHPYDLPIDLNYPQYIQVVFMCDAHSEYLPTCTCNCMCEACDRAKGTLLIIRRNNDLATLTRIHSS